VVVGWYSIYGTGATIYGIEPAKDGRVRFTSWLTVIWVPLVPLRTWSGIYAGEGPPGVISDESHGFVDLKREPHDWIRNLQTFCTGIVLAACAIVPPVALVLRLEGRGASTLEFVLVIGSAVWAVGLAIGSMHYRSYRLRRAHEARRKWLQGAGAHRPVVQPVATVEQTTKQLTAAVAEEERTRAERRTTRIVMICWTIIGGAVVIFFFSDYSVNGIPANYLGYALIGVGVLALLGVNVWWGGPLDKRLDR
jgi:hypothetical protein